MSKSYRPYHPEQEFLLPPSLREWLPENHLVYFVSDVVDNLNLSALDAVYGDEQRGQPPYDPRMMTKVLVYGYCVGVFSSRRIERRLAEDVGFRVLAAGNAPNFRTIADFRKLHLATLAGLFEEVLKIALEAGDKAVGVRVLAALYDKMKDAPYPVDLPALWQQLGIVQEGDTVRFVDSAPLAAIREGITFGLGTEATKAVAESSPRAIILGRRVDSVPIP